LVQYETHPICPDGFVRGDIDGSSNGQRDDSIEASQGCGGVIIDEAGDADAQHQDDRVRGAQQDEREASRIHATRARNASQQEGIEERIITNKRAGG
jgi:hypothetical protein